MSTTDILEAARAPPKEERFKLAQELWEIVLEEGYDLDPTPEQKAELDRRVAEFDPQKGISSEQIRAELKERK